MKQAVTIDEFLTLEEHGRKVARLRAAAREVRRFHAAVRRFANAWCVKPTRRIVSEESKTGVSLNLEMEDRYGWVEVMSLRAAHHKGEFYLRGPVADRRKAKMSADLRKALDNLVKTWRALPGSEPEGTGHVVVHLPKLADSGFDRFLETAVEACEPF
jgi:hypothetical protein